MNKDESQKVWQAYYKLSIDWPPREFLQKTVDRFDSTGFAIDLGCGTGTDALYLLERGWKVLAIDYQDSAISTLLSRISPDHEERLETQVSSFESLDLPPADLIWAGNSLPFCNSHHFPTLWDQIRSTLNQGGRFAGDFFGTRHAWIEREGMTFLTKKEVKQLCNGMNLEYLIEEEGQQLTAYAGYQAWHSFAITAQKL
jgi:tellurite methyltransferase